MKCRNTLFSILCLFLYITNIQSEGFFAGTLVKTPSEYCFIEKLKSQDKIFSSRLTRNSHSDHSIITKTIKYQSDSYVKIIIGNSILCCAPDQKLYSYNQQKWIKADKLTCTDILINDKYEPVFIDSIEIIQQSCKFQALALTPHHTYCVSPHNIVVHNAVPVVVMSLPVIISTITPIVETVLAAAGTFLGVHLISKKIKQKQSASSMNSSSSNNYGSYYPDPNDPHDDKYDKTKYPNGIYKAAKYHHQNSSGIKSASPKNGQALLNNALLVKKSTDTFIAIEENYFVVFYKTMEREFHAHIRTWNQLTQNMKNTLIEKGLVKRSGKIIQPFLKK